MSDVVELFNRYPSVMIGIMAHCFIPTSATHEAEVSAGQLVQRRTVTPRRPRPPPRVRHTHHRPVCNNKPFYRKSDFDRHFRTHHDPRNAKGRVSMRVRRQTATLFTVKKPVDRTPVDTAGGSTTAQKLGKGNSDDPRESHGKDQYSDHGKCIDGDGSMLHCDGHGDKTRHDELLTLDDAIHGPWLGHAGIEEFLQQMPGCTIKAVQDQARLKRVTHIALAPLMSLTSSGETPPTSSAPYSLDNGVVTTKLDYVNPSPLTEELSPEPVSRFLVSLHGSRPMHYEQCYENPTTKALAPGALAKRKPCPVSSSTAALTVPLLSSAYACTWMWYCSFGSTMAKPTVSGALSHTQSNLLSRVHTVDYVTCT